MKGHSHIFEADTDTLLFDIVEPWVMAGMRVVILSVLFLCFVHLEEGFVCFKKSFGDGTCRVKLRGRPTTAAACCSQEGVVAVHPDSVVHPTIVGRGGKTRFKCSPCATPIISINPEEVVGTWGSWSVFSDCRATCGSTFRFSWRRCLGSPPDGVTCSGQKVRTRPCHLQDCPVHGDWSAWTTWSACSVTCGGGHRVRVRRCDNPTPGPRGNPCTALPREIQPCDGVLLTCPVPECGDPAVTRPGGRIVGGREALSSTWPWQAGLYYLNGSHTLFWCGATLISHSFLLTAAHCVDGRPPLTRWRVRLGDHNRLQTDPGETRMLTLSDVIIHPGYRRSTFTLDAALLRLNQSISFTSTVSPVCLPFGVDFFPGMNCTATGWGHTQENGYHSDVLKEVDVALVSLSDCEAAVQGWVRPTHNMVCAGGDPEGGKDACTGDSGGPLVCPVDGVWFQAGVTSWGEGCAQPASPGMYTRVTEIIHWISNHDNQVAGEWEWSPWMEWSECSVECGGGRRTRIRLCINSRSQRSADFCPGNGSLTHSCHAYPCQGQLVY